MTVRWLGFVVELRWEGWRARIVCPRCKRSARWGWHGTWRGWSLCKER